MIYSRCKCGEIECWDSGMSPAKCCPCDKCGTVPSWGPNYHPTPIPHEYTMSGRCRWCLKKEPLLEVEDGTPY